MSDVVYLLASMPAHRADNLPKKILGEYIGRIHHEMKQRQPFIVERVERKNS